MRIIYLSQGAAVEPSEPCVATLGFFDGVHLGHRYLISHVVDHARARGLRSMVITLDRHPRQVLQQDYQPELLTTLDAKLRLLTKTGVDIVAVLHFDEAMAALSARDFMSQVLLSKLSVHSLFIGYDNRFGRGRAESFDNYVEYGREMGIEVMRDEAFELNGIKVSSSVVRAFLREGEIALANRCLGYTYALSGTVVGGHMKGRELGFPTANLDIAGTGQLVPAAGIYATQVRLADGETMMPAMTDIGCRPTFGTFGQTIETNIFNFDSDIYGLQMRLYFVQRIRSEKKFDNVTQLVAQLKEDERVVEAIFNGKDANK